MGRCQRHEYRPVRGGVDSQLLFLIARKAGFDKMLPGEGSDFLPLSVMLDVSSDELEAGVPRSSGERTKGSAAIGRSAHFGKVGR